MKVSTRAVRSGSPGIFGLLEAARDYRAGGPGPKASLLALMERMGEHEPGVWSCWPSMGTLAEDTEQSEGTVRRHVAAFEMAGLITRQSRGQEGGGRASNLFVLDVALLLDQTDHDARIASDQTAHPGGANRASGGGQTAHPTVGAPHIEHPEEEPPENSDPSTDVDLDRGHPEYGFARFWGRYPKRNGKRNGKKRALEKWRRLTYEQKAAAWRAVNHYADAVDAGLVLSARDAERFLAADWYEEWADGPAEPDRRPRPAQGGSPSVLATLGDLYREETGWTALR